MPTAQSASSTYGERGRSGVVLLLVVVGEGGGGGGTYLEERGKWRGGVGGGT